MAEEKNKPIIIQVDPTTFEFQQYTEEDNILISSSRLDTAFSSSTDYIEYYAYDENQNQIYPLDPNVRAFDLKNYSVIEGDTCLYPAGDINNIGYDVGKYFSTYNFYRKILASDININYYISEISGDRTELRLKSNAISDEEMIAVGNDFATEREQSEYFLDYLLNFGNDQQVIANNFKVDTEEVEPSFLVKLYDPLPPQFQEKTTLWVVQEISTPQAYNVTLPYPDFEPNDFQVISGPNYSLKIVGQQGASGQEYNFNTLLGTDLTSSFEQLNNILDRKEVNINVNYEEYENFVHFSSAYTRLENFAYKVGLIENYTNQMTTNIGTETTNIEYSSSKALLSTKIDDIIKNFDGYEYFLYYNSGSSKSWPKTTSEMPYILASTGSTEAVSWLGNATDETGQAGSASIYDLNNGNYLYNAIPEYLRSDPSNQKYELFVDMVAQQYDNTWLYTKDLTNRFNADNRLDYGISRDLVADAIKDFGIKLYQSNFNTDDLYTAFLGITPSGSTFPFPYMTGSIGGAVATPSGYEYVDNEISASNDIVPLNSVNQSLYKRIYHNVPQLLKKKGTIGGLRALITSYGIPSTILRVSEFGGRDRDFTLDWDLEQDVYNYAFHLEGIDNYTALTSSFKANSKWPNLSTSPQSIQFRFKTNGIPTSSFYQNVWVGDTTRAFITLEYTGSGLGSGSYSGSVPSQSNAYGTMRFYPEGQVGYNNDRSASIDLPFFDGGWWSIQASYDYDNLSNNDAYIYGANRIGEEIGFSATHSVTVVDPQYWSATQVSYFPSASALTLNSIDYLPLTGALQEVRYWDCVLSESLFYDYVLNPYSTQGNSINSTPNELVFRADLGTELNTASRESIHPKVTGSWDITQSFNNDSAFHLIGNDTGSWLQNTESIYYNQTPGGIKNRVSDRVRIVNTIVPSGSTLSPYRSVQQESYPSGSNPSINYLEVAFSPQDQVNDDIIAQIGDFNLGEYIGDPRQISESKRSYPQLDALRDAYFTKYINSYDVNDFIRLIKFFDNSLFKMIEDFTPARTTLSSGVVIKQNLLERNVQAPPSMSYGNVTYSGSVKSFARDYNVHYAIERPGNTLINDDVLEVASAQNTTNLKDGRGATAITGSSNLSGFGATFVPLINSGQVNQFQVIETGSGYVLGEEIRLSSASISASVAPTLQAVAGSPTAVANDVNVVIKRGMLAPTLSPNSDFPQQNFASGSSIYRYSGGTAGVFEPFNNLFAAPVSQSNEEYSYFYCFTGSVSSTAIASSSIGFFGFNSQDGATATKIFMDSLSKGNRPVSDYGPNLYTNLNRISKSMADFPGKFGLEIEVDQLNTVVNNIYNPAKNNYLDLKAKYKVTGLNYISPPLLTSTPVTVTQQPNTNGTTAGSQTTATLAQSSTSGNGTGATFAISTISFSGGGSGGNANVAVTVADIGLDYNEGETVTFTAAALQAAGFPTAFDRDLIIEIGANNASTNDNTGYWDIDVTAVSTAFSAGTYVSSSFTYYLPYYQGVEAGEQQSLTTASYSAKLIMSEGPYSGLTNAEVSASQFYHQYPGFTQEFFEPSSTTLGIGMPLGSSITESTSNIFGQKPYQLKRFDQREFYNGEFINSIIPGILQDEPCKAFFGQDNRIDYFFYIQWFNDNTISEDNFLTSSAAFQPQPGNNWFWGDTVSFPGAGPANQITQESFVTSTNTFVTKRFTSNQFTYTGAGVQGQGGVIEANNLYGGTQGAITQVYFVNTSLIPNRPDLTSAVSTDTTNATNDTYSNISATSTSGGGSGATFNVTIIAQEISSIEAVATGSLYDPNDTITFAAGTFGASSTEAILTLRASDLFSGVQKKYNGGRTIKITQSTLVGVGFSGASGDLEGVLSSQDLDPVPSNKVKYIKMSDEDINGEDTTAFIQDSGYITYTLAGAANYLNELIDDGFETYYVSNTSIQSPPFGNQSVLIFVDQPPSTAAVTSFDELFYDFSFSASGKFVYYATSSGEDPNVVHETGITRSVAQGYFPPESDSPTSLWSTESFFRGWATANWWDNTADGGLQEVGNLGFLYDPLNNFNTGSNETNNDEENPYKPSVYPWYMNAGDQASGPSKDGSFGNGGETFLILSASSILGGLGATDLQFYTGSITASTELIPLAFEQFIPPSATNAPLTQNQNQAPLPPTISATPSGFYNLQNTGNGTLTINVTTTTNTTQWAASIQYLDGSGWILGVQTGFNTGTGTITFTVLNGYTGGGSFSQLGRQANINISNITNPAQSSITVPVQQFYNVQGGGGGFFSP